uniref:Uncharacterized protein n=1 Tax=Romanomermis culicivorax TaxID=13658 RepID=A0A915KKB5_ROMCU
MEYEPTAIIFYLKYEEPAASSLWPPRSDRHKNTDTVENSGGQHNTKLTVLLMNNVQARLETGADEAVQALTDAMSSLPSLSDSGSSTYYTPCTSSPARSPKISFSLRRNKNKSVFDMQQPSGTPSLENDKIALSPR